MPPNVKGTIIWSAYVYIDNPEVPDPENGESRDYFEKNIRKTFVEGRHLGDNVNLEAVYNAVHFQYKSWEDPQDSIKLKDAISKVENHHVSLDVRALKASLYIKISDFIC